MDMAKPKIRFKGYTDDWEQRKLSELLYLSSERNDGSYTRDDVLAASLGTELQKKHIYFGLRATDESVKNYKVVLPNDVIYTKSPIKGFPNGIIRTSKGENGIVPTLYCVYHSVDVINPSIIQAYFESKERLDAYLVPLVNIGARNNVNITDKEFLDGSLCIPKDKAEQDKIVNVLERLSNLITLHQRKCEETKKLKKYMLQKMFPQNGQTVPEIRFSGFTDAWEQRKLNEYFNVSTAKNKDNHYGKEDVLSVSGDYGIVNQIKFQGRSFAGATVANYGVVNTGDVVYTKSPLSTNPYGIIKANKGKAGIVSTLYAVYKPCKNVNSEFVQVYFELNSRMNNYMQPLVNKGAKNDMKVTAENALKGGVCFPKLNEQDVIVEYFRSLDHLITLHQHKCEQLQSMKKFMLQNMFV